MPSPNVTRRIGRYEVVDRLGQGGMGVVYRAYDPRIGRPVAIKLLRLRDEDVRQRFIQEAKSSGGLKHPNIVTVYDFGEHEEQPFLVMELIDGTSLADVIGRKYALSLSRKLELMEGLAAGLEYAHNRGVIHRDVKPANLMIDSDGVLKILDFGIAHVGDSSLTASGVMMGTPNYMSPEQIEGTDIDRRSDLFAVGLVFYELLTYRQAFGGQSIHTVMNAIANTPPVPLRDLVDDLEPGVEAIVDRALQKDPAKRYQTLGSMSIDLVRIRQRLAAQDAALGESETVANPPVTPPRGRTPRGIDSEVLSQRRAAAIEAHLSAGRAAFEAGDYAGALESAEQAAMLDPDEGQAFDLLDRARRALDVQQIDEWLAAAGVRLESGELDDAEALIARALELDPESNVARHAQARLVEARGRVQRELERARLVQETLEEARRALQSGDLEGALRAASEVLVLDPRHVEARDLGRQALAAIEERHRLDEIDSAARAAVDAARNEFAAGGWSEAISALERYQPPHPIVTEAAAALRAERTAIERRLEEERQRREQEAREAEKRARLAQKLTEAQQAFTRGDLAGARALVDAALEIEPDRAALRLRGQIEAAVDEQRRQEALSRRAADAVAAARQRFADGQRTEALADLRRFTPFHDSVSAAIRQFEQAIEELERARLEAERQAREAERQAREAVERQAREAERLARARAIDGLIERAREALRSSQHEDAAIFLEQAAGFDAPADVLAPLSAQVAARREEARLREERERAAGALVQRARQLFDAGERARALEQLAAFSPEHPEVSDLLLELRAADREIERLEEEARERERQLERSRETLARGRVALERGELDGAARLADETLVIDPNSGEARVLRERARAAMQELREREAKAARRRDAQQLASADIAEGRFAAALERLTGLAAAEGATPETDALIAQANAGQAAVRAHEERVARTIAEARRRFERGEHDEALTLLQAFMPPDDTIAAVLAELREESRGIRKRANEELRRQREEEARQAEVRRAADAARQEQEARELAARRAAEEAEREAAALAARQAAETALLQREAQEAAARAVALNAETERVPRDAVAAALPAITPLPANDVPRIETTPPEPTPAPAYVPAPPLGVPNFTPLDTESDTSATGTSPVTQIQRRPVSIQTLAIGIAAALAVVVIAATIAGLALRTSTSTSTPPVTSVVSVPTSIPVTSSVPPRTTTSSAAPVTSSASVPATSSITAGPPPTPTALLVIDAAPWAEVVGVRDEANKPVTLKGASFTPLSLHVPAGRYTVVLRTPGRDRTETVPVTVNPSTGGRAFVQFQSVDAGEYFKKVGS